MTNKIKMLAAGLATVVVVMAMSAAPAGAWFKSLNQAKTSGQVKLQVTTLTGGGATVSCQNASGEWKIQTEGNWWEHEQNGKQLKTTFGPHLYIKISQWNNCIAKVGLFKAGTKMEVSECIFQLEQPTKGVNKGTATLTSSCVIKVPEAKCTITLPPGTHAGGNEGLSEVKGKNEAQSVLAKAAVEGITGEESGSCTEKFTNGKFESGEGGLRALGLELA